MSIVISSSVRRWLVPASAALAVIGGGVAVGLITQAADRTPPSRSAAELLVDLQTATVEGLSGTVVIRVDLGLPPLPTGDAGGADLSTLASGTHTLRVWYASPDQARLAILGEQGETDVITNGTDVWTWSSRTNTATHRTITPGTPAQGPMPLPLPSADGFGMTPEALARAALALLEPSTDVTTDGSASVAGRDAYELKLAPRDPASLIGSIHLAIDAVEHIPLRVAVYARGSDDPAFEVVFTQISFDRPDASRFTFNPPPGATVVEATSSGDGGDPAKPDAAKPDAAKPGAGRPDRLGSDFATVGTGWTTVFVARAPDVTAEGAPDGLAAMLQDLPKVSGDWGSGCVLTSRLFSVLLTDDGRILVGAVGPPRLFEAAADPAAKLGS